MVVKFAKLAKIDAPIRMAKSIALVRADCTRMSISTGKVKVPRASAKRNPPIAPIPAASVGVNQPPYMPPMTIPNSTRTPQILRSACRRCAQLERSPGGPSCGLRAVAIAAAAM